MSALKGGGQALPCVNPHYDGNWNKDPVINGMTLRDYFAAKAMQSILTEADWGDHRCSAENMASDAYKMADAMLAAREAA